MMKSLPTVLVLTCFSFTTTLTFPVHAEEYLALPDPGSEQISDDGKKVTYTLPDNKTVTFNIRTVEQPTEEPSGQEQQEPCNSSVYYTLGSNYYVQQSMDENPGMSDSEIQNKRQEILARQAEMGLDSGANYLKLLSDDEKYENGIPKSQQIDCSLTLDPWDKIYTRLSFNGPKSSYLSVQCQCSGGQCASIESPYTEEELRQLDHDNIADSDPPMLDFLPTSCGVEIDPSTGRFVDASGAPNIKCDPVKNVTINHCEIHGRVVARSFTNGFAYSSTRADHVDRLRDSAAQDITFDDVKIIGKYRDPVHFLPGVHHITIRDSIIEGGYAFGTIYLPADGGWNKIINNDIKGQTGNWDFDLTEPSGGKREIIAIDGSEYNRVVNNRFSRIPYGGIFLYRNCGEQSQIRNRPVQNNQIVNNIFDYEGGGTGGHPAIHVGSRDEMDICEFCTYRKYCYDDLDPVGEPYPGNDTPYPWDSRTFKNSSESNGDWAGHNTIAQNQFVNSSESWQTDQFIRLSEPAVRLDNNVVEDNRLESDIVSATSLQSSEGAGCAIQKGVDLDTDFNATLGVENGFKPFIRNGEEIDMFWKNRSPFELYCGRHRLRCENNVLSETPKILCDIKKKQAECSTEDLDEECNGSVFCPSGLNLVGAQAACNLEYGSVSLSDLDHTLMNRVRVTRASSILEDGLCVAKNTAIREGRLRIGNLLAGTGFDFSCREHDQNSGECHILTRLYCR